MVCFIGWNEVHHASKPRWSHRERHGVHHETARHSPHCNDLPVTDLDLLQGVPPEGLQDVCRKHDCASLPGHRVCLHRDGRRSNLERLDCQNPGWGYRQHRPPYCDLLWTSIRDGTVWTRPVKVRRDTWEEDGSGCKETAITCTWTEHQPRSSPLSRRRIPEEHNHLHWNQPRSVPNPKSDSNTCGHCRRARTSPSGSSRRRSRSGDRVVATSYPYPSHRCRSCGVP